MEPWCDPRRGYAPVTVRQQPRQDAATGGVLKRSLAEVERWQQALYLRAVRQRVDIGAVLARAAASRGSGFSGLSPPPSSTLSSLTTGSRMPPPPPPMQQLLRRQMVTTPPQAATRGPAARPATAREMVLLQELEKQLLGDDDDAGSACGSTVTSSASACGDTNTMQTQELNSMIPMASATHNYSAVPASRSPTNSSASSSTASSTASSSPPTSTASPRQLLSEAAAAAADGRHAAAAAHLAALKTSANPRGDAKQRLVAMMAAALSSRIAPSSQQQQHLTELCGAEQRAAWQLLHDVSPCFGLALHGANLAILDAVAGHRAVHVVDFDVSVAQHAALIQALAITRRRLRVTAVSDPASPFSRAQMEALAATGQRLRRHAQQAGLDFRFDAVSCRPGEIDAERLGCGEPGEALAVNLAFALSRIPDESVSPANPRDELLRRVRALGPLVVAVVEQELSTNTAPLAARLADACAHYGAVLESLDATLPQSGGDQIRARAEAALACKAANAVAREGPHRLERCEVFGKWRARFGMAGLRPVPIGQGVADAVTARLGHHARSPGFDVELDGGRIGVGWMGRVVTVASAWR